MIHSLEKRKLTFIISKPSIVELDHLNERKSVFMGGSLHSSIFPFKNIVNLTMKKKILSESFTQIFMKNKHFFIFFKHWLFHHGGALLMNGIVMFISVKHGNSCVFSNPEYQGQLNFGFFYGIIVETVFIFGGQCFIFLSIIMIWKKMFQILFTFIFLLEIFLLFSLNYEGKYSYDQVYNGVYELGIICIAVYDLILLLKMRCKIKIWINKFFKGGSFLLLVLISNFLFCFYVFRPLFQFIKEYFGVYWSTNLNKLILMLYSALFAFILKKLLFYHYESLLTEKLSKNEINFRVIIMNRFCLTYIMVINVVGIIRMEIDQWGAWLLVISYWLFLIKVLTRKNLKIFALEKLFSLICRRKWNKKTKKKTDNLVKKPIL